MELPTFKYHPDPVKTGSIEKSENVCRCCERARGYIYTPAVYAEEELNDCICPWCIADGRAHQRFDAEFTDYAGIGDYGSWEDVPNSVKEEVAFRTPGFSGWQQERWWTHCGDAAAYLGPAGSTEVARLGNDLIASLKEDMELEGPDWDEYLQALDAEGSPTAYVFKCLHCGKLGGYSDCH